VIHPAPAGCCSLNRRRIGEIGDCRERGESEAGDGARRRYKFRLAAAACPGRRLLGTVCANKCEGTLPPQSVRSSDHKPSNNLKANPPPDTTLAVGCCDVHCSFVGRGGVRSSFLPGEAVLAASRSRGTREAGLLEHDGSSLVVRRVRMWKKTALAAVLGVTRRS